jgi:ABC-type transport system involved in multi-copper enzyme maturation permease subunit
MLNLIKAEIYKATKMRSFIWFVLYGIYFALCAVFSKSNNTVVDLVFNVSKNCIFFLFLFLIMLTCNDFSKGTIKNIVSKGMSTIEIYISKLISCYIIYLAYTVGLSLIFLIYGCITLDFGTITGDVIIKQIYELLYIFSFIAWIFMISMIFRSTKRTIILCIISFYAIVLGGVIYISRHYSAADVLTLFNDFTKGIYNPINLLLVPIFGIITPTVLGIWNFESRDTK